MAGTDAVEFCRELRRLPPQCACDAIRLWCNGIPTSRRMHADDGVLPCMFCDRRHGDDVTHYVKCHRLRKELHKWLGIKVLDLGNVLHCVVFMRTLAMKRHSLNSS